MGVRNVQQLEGSYTVLLYLTLYTIICTHTEFLNDIDNTVFISCHGLMFKPDLKSVDKKNQLDVTFVFFISLLLVAQHVSGNHVPINRS